ncbi:MAG: glycosyltransferase [Fimbriimonas sp.]|nr:glycosyltransferase [Fimbriimonas sp.]
MPRVSILLTCFNHVKYLPACLEGVRRQGFRDFEVLAIDDGSTDGSREWLAEQADILCIFNESNLGTYETLNVGLKAASGEFIAVLNDDDLWEPDKLVRQLDLLDSHPDVGLVHTGGTFIDGEGNRRDGNPLGFAFPRFQTGDILLGLVYENKIIASAALARRECFDKVGPFNSAYFGSGDWEMWFRIAERYQVGFVDEPLTHYRVHGANASHKLERIWKDDERLREWIAPRLDGLESRFPASDIRKAKAFNQAALGTVKTLNGNAAAGRAAYAASIRLDPARWKSYARYAATFLGAKAFRKLL